MITTMRGRFKSKKYQPIIWIALISLFGAASIPELVKRLFGAGDWVIKVNGSTVSEQKFYQKVEEEKQYIDLIKKQFGPYASALFKEASFNPKDLAIKALINEILLSKVLNSLNVQIDEEYLKQELLKRVPKEVLQAYGTIDLNLLSQLFGYANVNDFRKQIEDALKNNLAIDFAQAALYVPEFELKNHFNSLYSKKKFSILVFPLEKYLNQVKNVPLNKDEINAFFQQATKNKQYWVQEKREGIKWEFPMSSLSVKVSDNDILNYYNKNKRVEFIEAPAQVQARRILLTYKDEKEKIKANELAHKIKAELKNDINKFADLVKKYSKDEETVNSGGLMDFFAKGQKDPMFENIAFSLKKVGDVSDVFEGKSGLEIIQLVSKKPVTFKKIDDVKDKIKSIVQKENFAKEFNSFMAKLVNNKNEFEEFAKQKGASSSKVPLTVSGDSVITQKLFSIKNENGFAVFTLDGKGIVVQLTKLQKSHIPTLESVLEKVKQDLYNKKAMQSLKTNLEKAFAQGKTKSMQQLKEQYGVELKTTNWLNADQKEEIQKLTKENIPVHQLLTMDKEDLIEQFTNDKYGFLIKLEHIAPLNIEEYSAKKELIEQDLTRSRRQELDAGFIASLKKNAKININDKALKQIKHG